MKRKLALMTAMFICLASAPMTSVSAVSVDTASIESVEVSEFNNDDFFVMVGNYKDVPQLRYYYPSGGGYYYKTVLWTNPSDDISYGDIFVADSGIEFTSVYPYESDPVYSHAYYYLMNDDAVLKKVGTCNDLMETKEVSVTDSLYGGSGYFNVNVTDTDGEKYVYGYNSMVSSREVQIPHGSDETYLFAFYRGEIIIPILENEEETLLGDANCDGEVTISDAVAILQYLANSEKYPLSKKGIKNADIDGGGVSGTDALEIQRMDAKSAVEKLEEKEPLLARVNWSCNPDAFTKCANADKIDDKTENHTPVFVCRTSDEFDSLVDYISEEYNTKSDINGGNVEFTEAVEIYKENTDFFNDKFLIVVNIDANSGSIQHKLNRVDKNGNEEIKVYIDRTSSQVVTCDMAEYFMFIECSKEILGENTSFDAVLSDIQIINGYNG